jgi:hypothetical protein
MKVQARVNENDATCNGRYALNQFTVVFELPQVVCRAGESDRAHEMLCGIKRHRRRRHQ